MRLGPIELFKKLPKTNCGERGHASCLAFATQVVGYGQALEDCPHLDEVTCQEVSRTIEAQTKIFFDALAMEYLDLEGLTFVAEKLADNLISKKGGV